LNPLGYIGSRTITLGLTEVHSAVVPKKKKMNTKKEKKKGEIC